MKFYIPAPDEWDPRTRVELTFGLGDAIRYHREMTVPGIGGLRYVRQACWAVAGIDIANKKITDKPYQAREVANAIEALGCKVEYRHIGKENYKHIGSRAFNRNPDACFFCDLKNESFYVRNTYRQTIVTALTSLGFCDTSTRFNQMRLTDKGEDLKNAFYQSDIVYKKKENDRKSKGSCGDFLFEWVQGNESNVFENDDFYKALSIAEVTKEEKEILWKRLYTQTGKIMYDPNRRIRLMEVMKKIDINSSTEDVLCDKLKEMEGLDHSKQIYDAIRFNEMLRCSVGLLYACAWMVESQGKREIELIKCQNNDSIKNAYCNLQEACNKYFSNLHKPEDVPSSAKQFANMIKEKNILDGIAYLTSREYGVLDVVNNRIRPLNLFDKFLGRFSEKENGQEKEIDEEGFADISVNAIYNQKGFKLPRLNQWAELWVDSYVK